MSVGDCYCLITCENGIGGFTSSWQLTGYSFGIALITMFLMVFFLWVFRDLIFEGECKRRGLQERPRKAKTNGV